MTAFIAAPKGPHIGQCQNFFLGEGGPGDRGRYCLEPVMALGTALPLDRDICQVCHTQTAEFAEKYVAHGAEDIASDPDYRDQWIERTRASITDLDQFRVRRAREGASMEELYGLKQHIDRRVNLLEAVLTAKRLRGSGVWDV